MKKSLDFTFHPSNYLEEMNFIQSFASAYIFLEASENPASIFYDPDTGGMCFGCGSGGELHHCKKDKTAAKRCAFFFLFNTMCGNSALRRRFNGESTEMQKLTGENNQTCDSEFTVDFLFGYTGYDYRKCSDATLFKGEIVAAIDAGKPVIAKVKSGAPRFYLINGYDGDELTCPDFPNNHWNIGPDVPPAYEDLDVVYIFGDKASRRYTLKDGLLNIRRTMECNIREHVLDSYLTKWGWDSFPSDDGFDKASPEERKARAARLDDTSRYFFNIVSYIGAFMSDPAPHSHYLHQEIWVHPAFDELAASMNEQHWIILNAGHKISEFANRDWLNIDPVQIPSLCTEICGLIANIKAADIKLLDLINQAIEVVDEKGEEM